MNNIQLKTWLPSRQFWLVIAFLLNLSSAQAQQQKADFGMGSKCLEAYAEAYGSMVGDSCSSVYWKVDGQTKQGNPLTYKFSAPGTYEICLKVLNTCSKWDTMICKKITVDTCPTKKCDIKAEINVHKLFGSYWLFKAGGNGTHFEWDFGDGSSAVGQTPWHRITKRGYHTICLTAYNADKTCSTKVCKTIWVGSPCNLKGDFMMKHNGNGEYQFKVMKTNGYSYNWDFGDGHSGTGADPKHAYNKPGTYNICLTITSKDGACKKTICKKITIQKGSCDLSKAKWNYSLKCQTMTVEHSNLNLNNPDSCWSYRYLIKQNGQVLYQASSYDKNYFSYQFRSNGNYVVCISFVNNCTGCDTTICKEVAVKCETKPCDWSRLQIGYNHGQGADCNQYTFELGSYDSCLRYITYLYPLNGGKLDTLSDNRVFKHTFKDTGSYYMIYSIKNICNNCDTTIYQKIHVECGSSNTNKCDWSKVKLAWSNNCNQYKFEVSGTVDTCFKHNIIVYSRNQGTTYTTRTFGHTFTDTGIVYVRVSISNTCTGCDTLFYVPVHVECLPSSKKCDWSKLQIGYNNKCRTYTFELGSYDSCLSYFTRVYYPKTQKVDTASDNRVFSYTFKDTGTFYMVHTLKNHCTGCDTTIYQKIHVECTENNSKCDWSGASWAMGNNCNKYTFEGKSYNDTCIKYTWKMGSNGAMYTMSNDRVFKYTFNYKGNYTVCLTLTNTCKNCDTTICKTVEVSCLPCPASAEFVIDSISAKGQVYLRNTSSNANTYFWDFGDSSYSYQYSPSKTYAQSGTYTICLKVYNQQSNCYNTYCKTITVVMKRSNEIGAQTLVLYPNPAQESIRLEGAEMGSTYEIHNAMGQKVSQGTWTGSDIPVRDLANGYYRLQLKQAAPIPFVVQHN